MLSYKTVDYRNKKTKYALLIPTLNEGKYILSQFKRMKDSNIFNVVDVYILDSYSSDGSVDDDILNYFGITSKLVVYTGQQGSAFRCGFYEALKRGYQGVITIDGNNKDSVEDIPKFINALDKGYDFIQGSRFMKGGTHKNTLLFRLLSNKLILIPWCRLLAKYPFTEIASAFRGMSKKFLMDPQLSITRDCFVGYELLWYTSVMAARLKYKIKEIPVSRIYPSKKNFRQK